MVVFMHKPQLAQIGLLIVLLVGAIAGVYLSQRQTSYRQQAAGSSTVKTYTNTPGSVASSNYSMSVNGEPIFVEKYKDISYTRFSFSGTVNITVTASRDTSSFSLSPKSYNIRATPNGSNLSFSISQPRKLIVTVNDLEKLFIFADPLEVNPPQLGQANVINVLNYVTDNTGQTLQTNQIQQAIDATSVHNGGGEGILYFPNGKYLAGTFLMKNNVQLYLQDGALIQGPTSLNDYTNESIILAQDVRNIKLFGRGIVDVDGARLRSQYGDAGKKSNLKVFNSTNVTLDGLILRDSSGWTIHTDYVDNINMKNVKIINDINASNTDGIDPDSATNVTLDDIFIYTGDDCFAVKTRNGWGLLKPANNIIIKNSVCWTNKSGLKIGTETKANITNVTFQNNDIVHADRAMYLAMKDGATMDAVSFFTNKSEDISGDTQQSLIYFTIEKRDGEGFIKNVSVNDYTAYSFSPNDSQIHGLNDNHKIENVSFKNLTIEGTLRLSANDARVDLNETKNVTFTSGPSATPLPSPTPVAYATPTTSNLPKGFHDSSTCTRTSGWTCDEDDFGKALDVHLYSDGPAGVGTLFQSAKADLDRGEGVAAQCGGNALHGYNVSTPDSLKDNKPHDVYVYAINIGSGNYNPLLLGSPQSVSCAPPTPTPTHGITPGITASVTPSPTRGITPTSTPIPTTTPIPGNTSLFLTLSLEGVGVASSGANTTPIHQQRTVKVQIFNSNNQQVGSDLSGTVTFDQLTGLFTGIVDAGNLSTGVYTVKVKTDRYLRKLIPGIQNITYSQSNNLSQTTLTVGDTDNNNTLDIIDYNNLSSCYADKKQTLLCQFPQTADLDDNGTIDGIDYNYLIRNMSIQRGD